MLGRFNAVSVRGAFQVPAPFFQAVRWFVWILTGRKITSTVLRTIRALLFEIRFFSFESIQVINNSKNSN